MVYGQKRMYGRILEGDYAGKAYLAAEKAGEQEMYNEYPGGMTISGVTFIGHPFLYLQNKP